MESSAPVVEVEDAGAAPGGAVLLGGVAAAHRRTSVEAAVAGGRPIIIGVAGCSGSGKTSIAGALARRLAHLRVASMSSDSYYKTLPPGTDAGAYNFDAPSAIDFALLRDHLAALRARAAIETPVYDFSVHRRTASTIRIDGATTDVAIIEGIFVLHERDVAALCDVTVFTLEDLDVCLARRVRRDIAERGRDVESVLRQWLLFVKPGFRAFVEPSMDSADVIIPRARDNAVAIDMLARDLAARTGRARAGSVRGAVAGASGASALSSGALSGALSDRSHRDGEHGLPPRHVHAA